MTFVCHVCAKNYPPIFRNVHHIVPQSVGGTDDVSNLVELCPGCHDALHAIAYKLCNKKFGPGKIKDQLSIIYKENTDAIRRCYILASHVRDATMAAAETEKHPDSKSSVSFSIPYKFKKYLTIAAKEARVSQERYLQQVLMVHLKQRFNQLSGLDVSRELDRQ